MRFKQFFAENNHEDEETWADKALAAIGNAHEKHITKKYGVEHAKNANYGWGVDGDDHVLSVATKIYNPHGDGRHHTITTELFYPDLDEKDMQHSWDITQASKKGLGESKKGPEWAKRDWTKEADDLEKDIRDNGHDPGGNVGKVFQLARDMFSAVSVNGTPQHKILHDDLNHVETQYDKAEAIGDYDAMDRIILGPLNGVRHLHNIVRKRKLH